MKKKQHRIDLYMNLVHGPFMMNKKKRNRNGAAQNKENITHNNAVIFPIAFVLIDKISMSRDTCMQCCVFFRIIIKMQEQ